MKIHSRHLHAPLCGIFAPNSVYVAHYASLIGAKSPTKCDAQLAESNFQTHSRVKSYRFSFSWPRILPEGTGEVNPEGIAYYKQLITKLKENGIMPNATIYHWDLPYKLQLMGGFGNREIVGWFTNYARVLLENFGDDVDLWVTFNEPIAVYVGYAKGFFAPGLKNEMYARQSLHNLLLCHGETVKLFRKMHLRNAKIGIVVDIWKHFPKREGNAEDMAMAVKANEIEGYGMFTLERIPKKSAQWYANVTRAHGFD